MRAVYESAAEEASDARREVDWVLVAWPGLLLAAQKLLGMKLTCPCCGRWGRVAQVLELDEWRRRCREETS